MDPVIRFYHHQLVWTDLLAMNMLKTVTASENSLQFWVIKTVWELQVWGLVLRMGESNGTVAWKGYIFALEVKSYMTNSGLAGNCMERWGPEDHMWAPGSLTPGRYNLQIEITSFCSFYVITISFSFHPSIVLKSPSNVHFCGEKSPSNTSNSNCKLGWNYDLDALDLFFVDMTILVICVLKMFSMTCSDVRMFWEWSQNDDWASTDD